MIVCSGGVTAAVMKAAAVTELGGGPAAPAAAPVDRRSLSEHDMMLAIHVAAWLRKRGKARGVGVDAAGCS